MNAHGMNAYGAKRKPHVMSKVRPVAAACAMLLVSQFATQLALANAGFGGNTNIANVNIAVPTYYANSPQGWQVALDANNQPIINPATISPANPGGTPYTVADAFIANGGATSGALPVPLIDTGRALRKFVDQVPGLYNGISGSDALGVNMGLPLAITDQWQDANGQPFNGNTDDYYEIALVEYTQQLHSDLAKPTRLRGYVQIDTPYLNGKKDATGLVASEHIPGKYPNGQPILDNKGNQVYFVHAPHTLGPVILATKNKPVRVKFSNYLPYTDVNGQSVGSATGMGGELPVPVDEYIAGGGPLTNPDGTPYLINGKPAKFGQNRATAHFHGGDTPWTGDGTPHEWFAPAGDISYSMVDATHPSGLGRGASFQNVPDMPDPGPGSQTLFFPNNQSGRLMWYHDHTSGLTKLNVYLGEASAYLIQDPVEQKLVGDLLGTSLAATSTLTSGPQAGQSVNSGVLDIAGIPLILQDKQFVPKNMGPNAVNTDGRVQSQDTKWDQTHWGAEGDLFFPHVYEVNQDPNAFDGTNPVGRWDWGPWFWPVFPAQYSLPTGNYGDVTATPEAFVDTPMVNGQVYPSMTVDPKTYRLRILNAANDRAVNLGIYQAVDAAGTVCDANNLNPVPSATWPGESNAPATCTELRMVPAATNSGLPASWPTDGRAGGVPDPLTAGPDLVQIGNETGLLPAPAVWSAQPVTFDQNVRSMTVLNVLNHQLLLMPAERADVLVDFSKYAGKTMILYNDAPAPLPGFDPRIDYFTGTGDQSGGGGAYDTAPGYGPNTRTLMQIKVNNVAAGAALDMGALAKALPVAYAKTRPQPIIPETVYNVAFKNADNAHDNYARIFTGSGSAPSFKYPIMGANGAAVTSGVQIGTENATTGLLDLTGAVSVTNGGSGYTTAPNVSFSTAPIAIGAVTPTATATVAGGVVTGITINNMDAGYFTSAPTLVIDPPAAGTQATAVVNLTAPAMNRIRVINKAIQELFEPVYGRMNATLAVELPFSSSTVATTIPLAYVDAPIDFMDAIKEGETQIWKITHNGVDSHPVHFHLVNIQVINRVDWAGVVKPPAANEVGWRETLRMNPLEDVYVAVRAEHPATPFGIPRSQRVLDPSQAIGAQMGFTQIDQMTGNAPTFQQQLVNGVSVNVPTTVYSNQLTDFDNEYVWHCHILGHEENDFMRPFIFHPTVLVPDAPGSVTVSGNTVSWIDPTPYGGQDAQGIPTAGFDANGHFVSSPKNEIGFRIVATDAANNQLLNVKVIANTTSYTDVTGVLATAANVTVTAYNAAGDSLPGNSATVASGSASAVVVGAAAGTAIDNLAAAAAANTATIAPAASANAVSAAADAALAAAAPLAPSAVAVKAGTPSGTVVLEWANNVAANVNSTSGFTNVTGYSLAWTNVATGTTVTWALNASLNHTLPNGATITGLASGAQYTYSLVANNALNQPVTGVTLSSATPVTGTVTAP